MTPDSKANFVLLIILDGWGIAPPAPGNAVTLANVVNFNKLWASFPHTQLGAAGDAVGLPSGNAGNTETGHLNLGAGRIVYQDLARINMSIADGTFFENKVLLEAIEHARKNNSKLHLMGLIGAGGVHSNIEHIFALLHLIKLHKFTNVYLHLFTDGRDSPQTASLTYIDKVQKDINNEGIGTIASVMGRYWSMDRDRRWDRTAKAYFALTAGKGNLVKTCDEAIRSSYSIGKTDEFIEPSLISSPEGKPLALIQDNDSVIFFNFRIDRPRQLTSAFIVKDFNNQSLALEFDPYLEKYAKTNIAERVSGYQKVFDRGQPLKNLFFATMTEYSKSLLEAGAKVAFLPETISMPLSRVISERNLRQFKITESEKERFITFYFNGFREDAFPGEEISIIPSANVPTYDLKPEMSAVEITNTVLEKIKSSPDYSFIMVNFANADMVGHTGNIGSAVKACEVVDKCLGQIANAVMAYNGMLFITADHGNVEEMINLSSNQIDTEHSKNPVPLIAISKSLTGNSSVLSSGILADVAPTIISALGIPIPSTMTGRNLLGSL